VLRFRHGPARLHSEYVLLADIVLATPSTVFQDKPHFEFGIVPGDGVHLLWQEVIGTVRGRYFILTRQELDAQTAKEWGAVNEIVPADKLLPRAREITEGLPCKSWLRLIELMRFHRELRIRRTLSGGRRRLSQDRILTGTWRRSGSHVAGRSGVHSPRQARGRTRIRADHRAVNRRRHAGADQQGRGVLRCKAKLIPVPG
jgi:enoyl-CoA hydratase/carnithine racemase